MFGLGNFSGVPTMTSPLAGMGHYGDIEAPHAPNLFRPEMRPDGLTMCETPAYVGDLLFRLFNAPAPPAPLTLDFVGMMALIALPMVLFLLASKSA